MNKEAYELGVKLALSDAELIKEARINLLRALGMVGVPTAAGAGIGALLSPEERLRGALIGGAAGAALPFTAMAGEQLGRGVGRALGQRRGLKLFAKTPTGKAMTERLRAAYSPRRIERILEGGPLKPTRPETVEKLRRIVEGYKEPFVREMRRRGLRAGGAIGGTAGLAAPIAAGAAAL